MYVWREVVSLPKCLPQTLVFDLPSHYDGAQQLAINCYVYSNSVCGIISPTRLKPMSVQIINHGIANRESRAGPGVLKIIRAARSTVPG